MGMRGRPTYPEMAREISVLVVGAGLKTAIPLLAETGFRASLCPDASRALKALDNQRHHIVLVGLDTLELKGMKFVKLVRERFPQAALVVAAEPGRLYNAMLAMISGASGYIQTPLRPDNVCSTLNSALKRRRLESALPVFSRPITASPGFMVRRSSRKRSAQSAATTPRSPITSKSAIDSPCTP